MAKQDVISNGPSGRALKFLNNKNNLADLYLKKRLAQFDREKTFSVSHMDRDKFDTVDVLKQIHQCDSDLLPASQRQHSAKSGICLAINEQEKKGPEKQGEKSCFTLPQLERRQSIYLQVASFARNPDERSVDSESGNDSDQESPREKPRRMSSRRKSFMAWIEGNRNANGSLLPDCIREARVGKQERRRVSFFNWLDKRNNTKLDLIDESADNLNTIFEKDEQSVPTSATGTGNLTSRTGNLTSRVGRFKAVSNNVIGSLFYMKRKPLDVRLSDFYERLEELKLEQEKYYTGPSWEEQRRKWMLFTKGTKAALALSSDEEDEN
ncbi:hypothetical protein KUTeg_023168 [Tegillarca granosa]|uniref:Uncharacterized protein n=1 Tax=Tegillarca granosa TaxID=220873 RepID=A0ABQ9E0V7_TEGGR|nr:hypothetical protein KUTeg_023168 [Tegillarca granosa]